MINGLIDTILTIVSFVVALQLVIIGAQVLL